MAIIIWWQGTEIKNQGDINFKAFRGTRVLVLGAYAYPDSFEWHVTDSLRHLECEVQLFHVRGALSGAAGLAYKAMHKATQLLLREPERLIEPRLMRTIEAFKPDVVLALLGNLYSPKTIAAVRKRTAAPVICWCQDQLSTLGRQFLLGAGYDAVFVKDRYMQDLFSRMIRSTRFLYLPEACNPRMHRPVPLTASDRQSFGCDVMIAGTLYYYRQEILQQLSSFDIKVWGYRPTWLVDRIPGRFMGRDVHGDDKVRACLASKICLNTLHYAEINGLNCRAFELAGCGGFQLVNRVPVLLDHFTPDVEVATFESIDELRDKINFYLANPAAATAIAENGRRRAHRDHTYEHRLRDILQVALS